MSLSALYDVPAPAKLNRFLHIVGRRADGYHLLESVFALIDWCDTLHFERRSDGRITRHDLGPALPEDDLCLRAARCLQATSGSTWGADISIFKHLPSGAGMGGGSSDAASTLLALNRLWGLHWPRQQLAQLGLALGADVPFFISGDNALVQGVGERLMPIDLPVARYAVVKPQASIATQSIFEHPALKRNTKPLAETATLLGSLECDGDFGCNDLQAAAEEQCDEVSAVAIWLQNRFGNSRMTGSGSAVFSRVEGSRGADSGADFLARDFFATDGIADRSSTALEANDLLPGWISRMCLGLRSHPLRDWAA